MKKTTRNILKKMGNIRPPSNSAIYESPFGMFPELQTQEKTIPKTK